MVRLWANSVLAHQGGIQAGDVGFDDTLGHAGGKEVERRPGMLGAVAGSIGRQSLSGTEVGSHDQRIENAGSWAGVGQAFVASRCHSSEREGGSTQHAGQSLYLAYV